jgi:hypothetical protein
MIYFLLGDYTGIRIDADHIERVGTGRRPKTKRVLLVIPLDQNGQVSTISRSLPFGVLGNRN